MQTPFCTGLVPVLLLGLYPSTPSALGGYGQALSITWNTTMADIDLSRFNLIFDIDAGPFAIGSMKTTRRSCAIKSVGPLVITSQSRFTQSSQLSPSPSPQPCPLPLVRVKGFLLRLLIQLRFPPLISLLCIPFSSTSLGMSPWFVSLRTRQLNFERLPRSL